MALFVCKGTNSSNIWNELNVHRTNLSTKVLLSECLKKKYTNNKKKVYSINRCVQVKMYFKYHLNYKLHAINRWLFNFICNTVNMILFASIS